MTSKLHHVCVAEYEIEFSPSRENGLSLETETQLRSYGCELIDDMGYLLDLYASIPLPFILYHQLCPISSDTLLFMVV